MRHLLSASEEKVKPQHMVKTFGENATTAIPMPDVRKDSQKIRFRPALFDTDKTKNLAIPLTHRPAEPMAKNYRACDFRFIFLFFPSSFTIRRSNSRC